MLFKLSAHQSGSWLPSVLQPGPAQRKQWFLAEEAGEVTPEDLHCGPHDELADLITRFLAGISERSPDTAQLLVKSSMRSEKNSGLHCSHGFPGNRLLRSVGDTLPSVSDFKERYCGCWDSFEDYATVVEDICLMDGWPEEAKRYSTGNHGPKTSNRVHSHQRA